jgi:membrane protease YdiL (CAAX protease family)
LPGTIAHLGNLTNLGLYGVANLGLTIFCVILISAKRWWAVVGFRPPRRKSDLFYFIIPFLPVAFNFIPGLEITSVGHLLEILAIALLVGFVEEVLFRGVMLQSLKTRGPWQAVIITALLFGLTHALNVLAGKDALQGADQVFYALGIGFAFGALVLKKGIIWPLVVAHFSIDFVNYLQRPGYSYLPGVEISIAAGIGVVFVAYGTFIMMQKADRS